ncbi:MAG TPA: MFS transporter [Candidatus Limnocylindrales bacterium]
MSSSSLLRGVLSPYEAIGGNRPLQRFLVSEFVSSIGDWLYLVAMLVVVAESSDAVVLGVVGGARILPYVLLSGVGGVLADRYDRRRILIATDLARGVLMVALAAAIAVGAPIVVVVGLVVLAACGSSIAGPALSAYLPSLARDESELGPANAAWATLDNVAFIIGPAVAGVLTAIGGASGAMLLNAVSFGVVAVVLASLPPTGAVAGAAADALDAASTNAASTSLSPSGLRALTRQIAAPLLVDLGVSSVGGALGIATVVIATGTLGAGEAGTGWLNAATGVGGVVGGVAAGRLVDAPPRRVLAAGGIVAAVGLVALGAADQLAAAVVLVAIAATGLLVIDVANATYLQRVVADETRGRASGIFHTVGSLAFAASSTALPIAAASIGIGAALVAVVIVGAVFVATGIVLVAVPAETALARLSLRVLEASALGSLPVSHLAAAAARATALAVESGDTVVAEGEPADAAYVVERGTFRVTIGGRRRRELGPGDLFGERGLLLGRPRSATVRAEEPGSLVRLDREAFLALVRTDDRAPDRLLALYARRR